MSKETHTVYSTKLYEIVTSNNTAQGTEPHLITITDTKLYNLLMSRDDGVGAAGSSSSNNGDYEAAGEGEPQPQPPPLPPPVNNETKVEEVAAPALLPDVTPAAASGEIEEVAAPALLPVVTPAAASDDEDSGDNYDPLTGKHSKDYKQQLEKLHKLINGLKLQRGGGGGLLRSDKQLRLALHANSITNELTRSALALLHDAFASLDITLTDHIALKDENACLQRKVDELENQNSDLCNTIACLRDEIEDSCHGLTCTITCLAADLADKKEIVNTNDDLFEENALLKDKNARLLAELKKENAKKPALRNNTVKNYREPSSKTKLRRPE